MSTNAATTSRVGTATMSAHPTLLEWKKLRFVIMDAPKANNLHLYLRELKKQNVVCVVRVCEPTYPASEVEAAGMKVRPQTRTCRVLIRHSCYHTTSSRLFFNTDLARRGGVLDHHTLYSVPMIQFEQSRVDAALLDPSSNTSPHPLHSIAIFHLPPFRGSCWRWSTTMVGLRPWKSSTAGSMWCRPRSTTPPTARGPTDRDQRSRCTAWQGWGGRQCWWLSLSSNTAR